MIPYDLDAEAEVLGSAVADRHVRDRLMAIVTAEDFHDVRHQKVFKGLLAQSIEGEVADLTLLVARCGVERQLLVRLQAQGSITSWVGKARLLAELGCRRRLLGELGDARVGASDLTCDLGDLLDAVGAIGERVQAPLLEPVTAENIVDLREGAQSDWAIPGVMRRRERIIFTGGEGAGKSHLGRWCAMSIAAGRAPFDLDVAVPALSTLVVDMENEAYEVGAAARAIAGPLGYTDGCAAISRTQGMDLANKRDARWLSSLIAGMKPALVVIGPLYKMYRGAEGRSKASEEAAEIVAEVLDELRVAYDCALWIEAHAPHGEAGNRDNGRPRGSSMWLGWPNFGRYMERDRNDPDLVRLKRWRYDRHRGRAWPWALRETPRVPWVAVEDPSVRRAA